MTEGLTQAENIKYIAEYDRVLAMHRAGGSDPLIIRAIEDARIEHVARVEPYLRRALDGIARVSAECEGATWE